MASKAAIVRAVKALDPENDEHWTESGLPGMQAVITALGEPVSRADIQTVDWMRTDARDAAAKAAVMAVPEVPKAEAKGAAYCTFPEDVPADDQLVIARTPSGPILAKYRRRAAGVDDGFYSQPTKSAGFTQLDGPVDRWAALPDLG